MKFFCKSLSAILSAVVLITSALCFASCNSEKPKATTPKQEPPAEHEHVFSEEWKSDDKGHWRECECGEKTESEEHESGGEATHDEAETCEICGYKLNEKLKAFDGQRVLIVGNSYVFWGNGVILKATDVRSQSKRDNDKGYFYQLCQDNGRDVFVTNWTFGGHALYHLLLDECTMDRKGCNLGGVCHRTDLQNTYYDYVIISPGSGTNEEKKFISTFMTLIDIFKSANPNVKIICLGNLGAHGVSSGKLDHPGIYESYATLEAKGVIIADWGGMVYDIMQGKTSVPGAKCTYTKNTFIAPDGYHPNQLGAYIQCLMAYCAVTGESAVGQPYAFCYDTNKHSKFNLDPFQYVSKSDYPNYTTNMSDVFYSKEDMTGIQMLIDQYLEEKPYR